MIWRYTEKDVILYALSIGCSRTESSFVYENDENFSPLPTFGVLPLHNGGLSSVDFQDLVPNFNPMLLLHGEQYLELKQPLPSSGELLTRTKIIDVLDKGKAAVVVVGMTTTDAVTGSVILENETTVFLRGSGGFGKSSPKPRNAAATAIVNIPARLPDATSIEQTGLDQAALYRLNGDKNPLHIDEEFAALGGFSRPILHGLCTFGISAKQVLTEFGQNMPGSIKSIKARFAKHVFPGETLKTEMWQVDGRTIAFQTTVVERNEVAISNGVITFHEGSLKKRSKL